MKKTLAAVLAAAMALSTATVAFAKDHDVTTDEDDIWVNGNGDDVISGILYGKDVTKNIVEITANGRTIDGYDLAAMVDGGYATVTAIVTEGSTKLAGKPSINLKRVDTGVNKPTTTTPVTGQYTWLYKYEFADGTKIISKVGNNVTKIPVFDNGSAWEFIGSYPGAAISGTDTVIIPNAAKQKLTWIDKDFNGSSYPGSGTVSGDSGFSDWCTYLDGASVIDPVPHSITGGGDIYDNQLQLKFKVTDTYNTSDTTIRMKLRITIKKSLDKTAFAKYAVDSDGYGWKKGDTLTTDEFSFKAKYNEMDDFNHDMQLTLEEVKARNVIFNGEKLYDEIGTDKFTITFEDAAIFEAKLSPSQKKLNLYYTLDEITTVTDAYPSVDFEFITFKGASSVTSFVNSGTMTFPALDGKNTQVYKLETAGGGDDGDTLVPLDGTYDSTYDTITVKGIKRLGGTFVVASEILEVEDDEDNEPVNSAPVVEEPSSSEAPSNDNERNPSTGAC